MVKYYYCLTFFQRTAHPFNTGSKGRVVTIVGAVVTAAVFFLIWRWARSLRTQRSMKRDFDERIAEAAGIVEIDEPDEGLTPQRT